MPFGKKPDTSKKVAFLDSLTNSRVHHTFLARVYVHEANLRGTRRAFLDSLTNSHVHHTFLARVCVGLTGSSHVCLMNPQQGAFLWDNKQEKLVDLVFQEKLALEQKGQETKVVNDSKGGIPGSRKLHIGGKLSAAGWEILNVLDGPNVDHVGDAVDLSRFADATFAEVYGSHGRRIVEQ